MRVATETVCAGATLCAHGPTAVIDDADGRVGDGGGRIWQNACWTETVAADHWRCQGAASQKEKQ